VEHATLDANRAAAMQQIKIFKGIENDLGSLEAEVNAWLAESSADVVSIFGNIAPQTPGSEVKSGGLSRSDFAPSDVLLVIHYRAQG
jgi:hypothetical protein